MKRIIIYIILFSFVLSGNAQNVKDGIDKSKALMNEGKYDEAYNILRTISDKQVEDRGDLIIATFNYYKGSCLYYLKKYEEAIPILQKGIQVRDKLQKKDCDYLEMLYGIGACYKEMKNYAKAEEYFRRTILKGTYMDLNCAIRNQTYREMAELYSLMGKPDFADICTSRIEAEMRIVDSKNFNERLDGLWEMFKAHQNMGKEEDCINDLKKMRHLIEENMGKTNEKYLDYSYLLGSHLRYSCNRPQEAAQVHREMIEIGKHFKTYHKDVCSAYVEYLRYLSENNKVDSIELILPTFIDYYRNTKDKFEGEENIYETIGIGLCEAQNFEEGIKFLEKKWNGKSAKSIKALDCLGFYYFLRLNKPEKALLYYKEAEKQINEGLEVNDNTRITILEYLVEINERLGNCQESKRYSEIIEPLILGTGDKQKYLRYLINWSSECVNSGNKEKCTELVNRINDLINYVSLDDRIIAYNQMAFACIKTNKYDEAIDYATKGISLIIKEKGEGSMILETLYHNLGRAYMLKGVYTKALSALNKSKELQLKHKGEVSQRTADYIKECESK